MKRNEKKRNNKKTQITKLDRKQNHSGCKDNEIDLEEKISIAFFFSRSSEYETEKIVFTICSDASDYIKQFGLTELLLMVLAFVKMAFIGKGSHKPIADYD